MVFQIRHYIEKFNKYEIGRQARYLKKIGFRSPERRQARHSKEIGFHSLERPPDSPFGRGIYVAVRAVRDASGLSSRPASKHVI